MKGIYCSFQSEQRAVGYLSLLDARQTGCCWYRREVIIIGAAWSNDYNDKCQKPKLQAACRSLPFALLQEGRWWRGCL